MEAIYLNFYSKAKIKSIFSFWVKDEMSSLCKVIFFFFSTWKSTVCQKKKKKLKQMHPKLQSMKHFTLYSIFGIYVLQVHGTDILIICLNKLASAFFEC